MFKTFVFREFLGNIQPRHNQILLQMLPCKILDCFLKHLFYIASTHMIKNDRSLIIALDEPRWEAIYLDF